MEEHPYIQYMHPETGELFIFKDDSKYVHLKDQQLFFHLIVSDLIQIRKQSNILNILEMH